MYINKYSDLWQHTMMRIEDAERKAKNFEDFSRKMVTRLHRITHEEKIHYAIAALKQKGYQDLVDVYEGRLIMEKLLSNGNTTFSNRSR